MHSISRLLAVVIIAFVSLSSMPVEAQRGRAQGRAPAVQVTGFSPARGGPGTRVTIRGRGFTPQVAVRLGGRRVQLESVRPDALTFVISNRDRSGPIVVRAPGSPDYHVGSFTITHDPVITSVSPGTHRIGARIQISGDGFERGDGIEVGGVALRVTNVTPRRITATLTPGVSTGPLTLVRGRQRYASNVIVQVAAPPPSLQAIQPASGTPGTRVRLTIANFDPSVRAFYGGTAMRTVRTGRDWIEVEIPANARRSEMITIRHRQGTSPGQRFELVPPLSIRTIAARPARGGGVELTIDGVGFARGAQVSVGNVVGRVTRVTNSRIIAVFPGHTPVSAPVVVQQGGQSTTSPRPLSAYRR